jgi:putative peptidoglycan lipid II flippase
VSNAKGLLGIASAIALVTLFSKGVGFFREVVVADVFGPGMARDAYTIAYTLPAFALIMLGGLTGPFHTATQKIITTLRQRGHDEQIPGVVATILVAVITVMGAFSLLAFAAAPVLITLVGGHPAPAVTALAIQQLKIMCPLVVIGGLVGVFCGISNDRGDYALPSFSPLIASVAVIGVCLAWRDPLALAWGTLVGGVGQFLLQAPAAWKLLRSGPQLKLDVRHPEIIDMAWLLVPAAVSSTIGTLNVMIGMRFTSQLNTGDISVFDIANKLLQLPLGILMTSLLIPLFPMLTRAAVDDDRPRLFLLLNQGLSTIAFATLPLIAFFVVAGGPLVATIFQHGAFDGNATVKTAAVLAFGALGIFTYAARDLMIRVFFALGDSRTPLIVSVLSLGLTAGFMALAIGPFGLNGLAAATSGVTIVNACLVAWLLRRKLGELPLGSSIPVIIKAGMAAVLGGAAAWAVVRGLPDVLGPLGMRGAMILKLVTQGATCGIIYTLVLAMLGIPVVERFRDITKRFRRAAPVAPGL